MMIINVPEMVPVPANPEISIVAPAPISKFALNFTINLLLAPGTIEE